MFDFAVLLRGKDARQKTYILHVRASPVLLASFVTGSTFQSVDPSKFYQTPNVKSNSDVSESVTSEFCLNVRICATCATRGSSLQGFVASDVAHTTKTSRS